MRHRFAGQINVDITGERGDKNRTPESTDNMGVSHVVTAQHSSDETCNWTLKMVFWDRREFTLRNVLT